MLVPPTKRREKEREPRPLVLELPLPPVYPDDRHEEKRESEETPRGVWQIEM